jgi:hypothetical protein
MSFAKTSELPTNPAVRIFFSGLLILEPEKDGKSCEVFVHNNSLDHNLSIEVRRKDTGHPDVIMMRLFGPLLPTLGGTPGRTGFSIRKTPGPKGIKGYDASRPSDEGASLGKAFNMQTLHDVPVGRVDLVGGLPSIFIDEGTFYAANLMPVTAQLQKKTPGSKPKDLAEIASILGANIYLNPKEKVTLTWKQSGKNLKLDLEQSNDFTYEIYINNEPLYEDDSATAPTHDEFEEYYSILPDITKLSEQFKLIFIKFHSRGSTRTPCMSVLLYDDPPPP